jgi:acetyltransferase-like isoleucine patch superfamily enzyme
MATFTEQKAKMLAGELYMANDPGLAADHLRAQALLAKFNATAADADEERRLLLKQLLGQIGEGTVLKPTFRCDYGYNITIGERTFINYDCLLLDCNRIAVGDEVQIAPGVHIYTPGATLWLGVCPARLDRRRRLVRGPRHRLSWCHHRCQYSGRGRQRGHPRFALQRSGSRKSLSCHPEAMKQPPR